MDSTAPLSIVALGDCNTIGVDKLEQPYSVPSCFAEQLQNRGYPCTLSNLGRTMSTSREGLALANDCQTKADILLLNYGLVDAWFTSLPSIYISYYPDSRWKKVARKLLKSLKKRLRGATERGILQKGAVVPADEYQENLGKIIKRFRQSNPQVKVILWGSAPTQHDPDRNQYLLHYDQRMQQLVGQNDLYIDSRRLLGSLSATQAYSDEVHLSEFGCQQLAKGMVEALFSQRDNA